MAKILIIDDEASVVELLKIHLTESGHQVVVAMDGMSGPMVASREKPDLIILDFNMPAADGAKVHERLRGSSFTAAAPIVFVTATPLAAIIPQVRHAPNTRFLLKPIDFSLLTRTIAEMLGSTMRYDPDDPDGSTGGTIYDLDS